MYKWSYNVSASIVVTFLNTGSESFFFKCQFFRSAGNVIQQIQKVWPNTLTRNFSRHTSRCTMPYPNLMSVHNCGVQLYKILYHNKNCKKEMQINICKLSARAIMKCQVVVPRFMIIWRMVVIPSYFYMGEIKFYTILLQRSVHQIELFNCTGKHSPSFWGAVVVVVGGLMWGGWVY